MVRNRTSTIKTGLIFAVFAVAVFIGRQDAIEIFLGVGAVDDKLMRVLVILR